MLPFLAQLALLLPLRSPMFYVNTGSVVAIVLYVTGAWHLAPNVAAGFFAIVVGANLVSNLFGHWTTTTLGGLS